MPDVTAIKAQAVKELTDRGIIFLEGLAVFAVIIVIAVLIFFVFKRFDEGQ